MLAFLNTPTFPVFSPPTYFNPAFIFRFYLSFIFYLAFIYCVLLFTNSIYHVMRTDTCNKASHIEGCSNWQKQKQKRPKQCHCNFVSKCPAFERDNFARPDSKE